MGHIHFCADKRSLGSSSKLDSAIYKGYDEDAWDFSLLVIVADSKLGVQKISSTQDSSTLSLMLQDALETNYWLTQIMPHCILACQHFCCEKPTFKE